MGLLNPQPVGNGEFDTVTHGLQPAHRFGQLELRRGFVGAETQRRAHLLRGVASCPNVGHRQRRTHAVRRKKQIAVLFPKLTVQIQSEGTVTGTRFLPRGTGARVARNQSGPEQQRKPDEHRHQPAHASPPSVASRVARARGPHLEAF